MKWSKFTEEQIALGLKQVETGTATDEFCRNRGISQAGIMQIHFATSIGVQFLLFRRPVGMAAVFSSFCVTVQFDWRA